MTNQLLQEIACPNCRNALAVSEDGRPVVCAGCGTQFLLPGHLCYRCHMYHQQEAVICSQCSTPLNRVCPECRTSNWGGNEHCQSCGSPLDVMNVLSRQQKGFTADRLAQQMVTGRQIKQQEEEASQRRMAEMMAIEEARQLELRQRLRKQKEQERQMLVLLFGGVGLFLIIVVLYILLTV
jgi:uncharacterized protein YbaR (Trm112 family)